LTQQQEKNFQISGGPYKTTGVAASNIPIESLLFDFFEKEEGEKNGYLPRDGSTQNSKGKADGAYRSLQKGTQKQRTFLLQRSNQCTYLDSPVAPKEWSQHGPVRGRASYPVFCCVDSETPHTFLDSQKILSPPGCGLMREDCWPSSMDHTRLLPNTHSTGMQPHFLQCILNPTLHRNYPHENIGCVPLHKTLPHHNSEAIATLFPRHDLEDMASFYHHFFQIDPYIFFLEANMLNNIPYMDIKKIYIGRFSEKKVIFEKNKNQNSLYDKVRRYGIYLPTAFFGDAC